MEELIVELSSMGVIPNNFIEVKRLSGGTTSSLVLVRYETGIDYVVKTNEPQVIEAETQFLARYRGLDILANLICSDSENRFIVYKFLEGNVGITGTDKKEVLTALVNRLINHYKIMDDHGGWGWIDEPQKSWQEFLRYRAMGAAENLGSTLEVEDLELVLKCIEQAEASEKYLLHGDCGYHNFIFNDSHFSGVIDPTPVLGEPLYDLIYAFCSTPAELTVETIVSSVSQLKHGQKFGMELYKDVLIGLYFRIGTCVMHHPEDLEEYLQAWQIWKEIVLGRKSEDGIRTLGGG